MVDEENVRVERMTMRRLLRSEWRSSYVILEKNRPNGVGFQCTHVFVWLSRFLLDHHVDYLHINGMKLVLNLVPMSTSGV